MAINPPDTIFNRNDSSGGTGPMPTSYRDASFEFMECDTKSLVEVVLTSKEGTTRVTG